jgi:hypothetical protein
VYDEKEIRAYLDNTRCQFLGSLVGPKEFDVPNALGSFDMPKMTDLFSDEIKGVSKKANLEVGISKKIAACSVIRVNYDMLPDLNGKPTNDFNEYTNPFLESTYSTAALTESQLSYIKKDK